MVFDLFSLLVDRGLISIMLSEVSIIMINGPSVVC